MPWSKLSNLFCSAKKTSHSDSQINALVLLSVKFFCSKLLLSVKFFCPKILLSVKFSCFRQPVKHNGSITPTASKNDIDFIPGFLYYNVIFKIFFFNIATIFNFLRYICNVERQDIVKIKFNLNA